MRHRINPVFEPEKWNVYDRTLKIFQTTSNGAEAGIGDFISHVI